MKINIIKIGNSLGIRLPKAVIEQCGFKDVVEAEAGDDALLDPEVFSLSSDKKDWKW